MKPVAVMIAAMTVIVMVMLSDRYRRDPGGGVNSCGRSPVHVLVPVDVGLRFDTSVP